MTLGTLDDSRLALYDAAETELAANDDFGESYASRIEWVATSPGQLFISVDGFGEGSYTLTVTEIDSSLVVIEHGDDFASASPIEVGEMVKGSIEDWLDYDYFVFQAEEGQGYRITLRQETLTDSQLTLYDATETELANDSDFLRDSGASRIEWVATSPGQLFISVHGLLEEGTYTLTVTEIDSSLVVIEHGDDFASASPIEVGEMVKGSIEDWPDYDYFVFQAEEGQGYRITLRQETLTDSQLTLYDATETELANDSDFLRDSGASRIEWVATSPGQLFVQVGSLLEEGSYTLTVTEIDSSLVVIEHGDDFASASPIEVGEMVKGSIEDWSDYDYFVFQAEEGQGYRITLRQETLTDSQLTLYNAAETELANDSDFLRDSGASRIEWVATSPGQLFVQVGSLLEEGSYTLTVTEIDSSLVVIEHGDDFASASPIEVGEMVKGSIEDWSDYDYFVFQAEEGQGYRITLRQETLTDSQLTLYNAAETELANDSDFLRDSGASRIEWVATSPGRYFVRVGGLLEEGTYTLTIAEQ